MCAGDPAAAACSTIALIHHPELNREHLDAENAWFFSEEYHGNMPLPAPPRSVTTG